MEKRLIAAGIALLVLSACSSYRTLHVDVLKPATLSLNSGENKILFADRKIIHESDTLTTKELKEILGMTRDDLVSHFYRGLQDGLRWGIKRTGIEKAPGVEPVYVADSLVPLPMTREEVEELVRERGVSHLLTVDYCKFRLLDRNRVELDDNMLLRIYDATTGTLVDTLVSDRLEATMAPVPEDYRAAIIEFFYQKGWSYAEHVTPVWIPTERRIYLGNKVLNYGYFLFERGDLAMAEEIWAVALQRKLPVAARAAVNVAWLLERDGEFEEAARLLESILERAGQHNIRASLLQYIQQQVEALKQRGEDDKKLMEQL